ncbi:hypothetical protein [uncultured Methanofollis sp.]|uniref:hypothetical protein n=1 Tax=uncultured Methanofollis sp. TaxID=262500 RepID=UPI00262FC51B|nr:hypothetical protein [uncultured Methanofollis sp.]
MSVAYIREVCTYLPISPGTAQTVLVRLEDKSVLASSQRGKIRLFRIKSGEISIQYFILAEIYKKIRFMEENPYISGILDRVSSCTQRYHSSLRELRERYGDRNLRPRYLRCRTI